LDTKERRYRFDAVVPGDGELAVVDGGEVLGEGRIVLRVHGEASLRCELAQHGRDELAGRALPFHEGDQA
jgi:hypothetical protein